MVLAELQGGALPPPLATLDAGSDRPAALAVPDVHGQLCGPLARPAQMHTADLRAQPAESPVAGGDALQGRDPAEQVGVDLLAGPAHQLVHPTVATDHLDDGGAEPRSERVQPGA